MTNCTHPFNPDWISPPGETIADLLEELDWTQAQLAKRLGYTTKHVSQLVNGKAPITEDTALKLARVLGSTEEFWLEREAQYRAALAKVEETECLENWVDWLDEIPVKALQKARKITDCRLDAKNKLGIVRELLEFFGVASPDEWRACYAQLEGQFRRSYTGQDNTNVITTWMRLGELEVEKQSCPRFNRIKFEKAIQEIRTLTVLPPEDSIPRLRQLCLEAGVLWVLVPKIPGARVSGLARWLNRHRPLIQMSLYGKSNDRFWFTFFHEAAHILLHEKASKEAIFLDEWEQGEKIESDQECEANEQARNWLIPPEYEAELYSLSSEEEVTTFAEKIGIHSGIVVGRLQYEGNFPWGWMNGLKERMTMDVIEKIFQPTDKAEQEKESVNSETADYEHLLQYIAETKNNKRQRSLQEFRGIAPNLLEGQEAQEWVIQMRDEWEERERVWRKPE